MSDAGTFPNPPDQVILAGDHTDDDGTLLGEWGQENPWPPTPDELPTSVAPTVETPVRTHNRLTARTLTVRVSQNAVMILQPDVTRVKLYLQFIAPTNPAAYVRIADDNAKVQMDIGSAEFVSGAYVLSLSDFTGALYAMVPAGDGAQDYGMTISMLAVTK